ncbi:MAG: UDP-3-O-(3-hydroxymyristoyl)glucosamine N-acyltransferase [Planctomycetes bacterium]|nr:UDP-3-O-(3-hydroxymyristoyl)glucosamine N-acyltransferase [Planctomycetota bacterium]
MPSYTLAEVAEAIGGTVVGNEAAKVSSVASLGEAKEGDITFLANPKYTERLQHTKATAAIVARNISSAPCSLVQVDNPDLAFTKAVSFLLPPPPRPAPGVHEKAVVAEGVKLGENVSIGACAIIEPGAEIGDGCAIYPNAYIGHDSKLGKDCVVYPGTVVYHRVQIGNRVILHANSVVGSDGFGYAWNGSEHVKIPQVGIVVICDDVEIGACTTIDRARFGKTMIGPGTKLDNQIQIAHNVELGAKCAFAAQSGVSGSTTVGNGVLMGGQSGIAGHIDIGDGAIFSGKSGVTKSLPGGEHYSGYPARPHKVMIDEWRNVKALTRMRAKLRELEERINELDGGKQAGE